jgi:hypothetical protein
MKIYTHLVYYHVHNESVMLDFINHKYIFRDYTMMVVFNLYYIKEKPVMSG